MRTEQRGEGDAAAVRAQEGQQHGPHPAGAQSRDIGTVENSGC
jgi:hypothetical protein